MYMYALSGPLLVPVGEGGGPCAVPAFCLVFPCLHCVERRVAAATLFIKTEHIWARLHFWKLCGCCAVLGRPCPQHAGIKGLGLGFRE